MAVSQNQPVAYIAPTGSSIDTGDSIVKTGASQGPPVLFIEQEDPIAIEVTPWVA
jgi:hypothetical protein